MKEREGKRNIPTSVHNNMHDVLRMMKLPVDTDENFTDTAQRFLRYLHSYTHEYDAAKDLAITFPPKRQVHGVYDRAMVVQAGIPYRAMCAHHLLPVLGVAHVGYIPQDRVVGLSKLARLVYGITHRLPSLQEDVCDEITEALMLHLKPIGAMCLISAEHGCMAARGVEEASGCIQTVTSSIKGIFQHDVEARHEFYKIVDQGR